MNTLFGDMAANIATFDPGAEAVNAARPHAEEIIRLNFEDQLYERGELADGSRLRPYKQSTVDKKDWYRTGPFPPYPTTGHERDVDMARRFRDTRTDHMTLKDTGFFQRSAKVKYTKDRFMITADDKKYSDDGGVVTFLTEEHGKEILGLTKENLGFVIEKYIKPSMLTVLRHRIFANKNTF